MIVITGLDGSGKSSFLARLEAEVQDKISILRVPTIDSENFKNNKFLYDQCEFVNHLGRKADLEKQPSLKIIALFASMILFKALIEELQKEGKPVFCERHPLIDTPVYARVYNKVMHPDNLNAEIALDIETNYKFELTGIIDRINAVIEISDKGKCYDLLSFLHGWFSNNENYSLDRLKTLFSVSIPDKVYFLDAPAEVLIQRIGERSEKEFHETVELLNKMRPIYLNKLSDIEAPMHIVDTTNPLVLESVFRKITNDL